MAISLLKPSPGVRKRLLIAAGSLLAFFLLMNYVLLPLYVNHGSRLVVPMVIGMSTEDARRALDSAQLQPVEADVRQDPTHPAGTVVFQNPLPGAIVKEGRRVYLTISGGEAMVTVPLLRGRSLRDAKFSLERYGLKIGNVMYAHSADFPENTVIEQTVPSDAKIARGSMVGVTISQGKLMEATTVPQLVGQTLSEAQKRLLEAGLKLGNVTYQPSFELLPNTIVDQFPRMGEAVPLGQAVDLFVVQVGKPQEEIRIREE